MNLSEQKSNSNLLSNLISLIGKRVLITGAAGSVGERACAVFRAAGAEVFGVDRNYVKLNELRTDGFLDEFLAGDLTDPAFCQVVGRLNPVPDVLVNNVGTGLSHSLANTSDEVLEEMLEINLRVAVRLCREIMPAMGNRRSGKVINVSSVLANHPVPTVSAYAASKSALIGFTRSVALEYAPRGIQVNALAPGYLAGPKNDEYFRSDIGQQFQLRFMPTGTIGTPNALDGPLLFLASAMSEHVTGHTLVVDGGYSIW
ncbi:MAG: SDR family oxidoreductase [Bacteroidales bacterium]|uniref:3-oxoacyl-[acyl-carrier-protein] reductase FabG n=1 Tax=Acidithiobacillus thiooxidans ATCC 19377 TaxID=637390 RepID=A0A543PZ09_ACITH|nr:SDR family oxidoreductase [Acidithiobacillus thiooxidans]MDX5936842.1 SDR family oxidoreductase [Acidithiobacillus thiooxidans]MDX5936884.1 SDR family oxidoreductase [Acidithiobacillus thiooxidans]TQN49271.1 3-oxoacyl-[acyl-carrier-protein] reductase FabG [Acidithiobacillus thiooxidans ATCC 19377]